MTRDQVLQAAREAFAERGFEGTTLAAIAGRLDVSPAALLRHAPTKEALFREALASGGQEPLPSDFLAGVSGSEDPARVLRRLALTLEPFIERKMGETIAGFLRAGAGEESAAGVRLPFDPRRRNSPPARVLAALEDYLRRARSAGRVRVKDPRAAALTYMGAIQSYVFMHRVARLSPPIPLTRYVGALLGIWTRGAIAADRRPK